MNYHKISTNILIIFYDNMWSASKQATSFFSKIINKKAIAFLNKLTKYKIIMEYCNCNQLNS